MCTPGAERSGCAWNGSTSCRSWCPSLRRNVAHPGRKKHRRDAKSAEASRESQVFSEALLVKKCWPDSRQAKVPYGAWHVSAEESVDLRFRIERIHRSGYPREWQRAEVDGADTRGADLVDLPGDRLKSCPGTGWDFSPPRSSPARFQVRPIGKSPDRARRPATRGPGL